MQHDRNIFILAADASPSGTLRHSTPSSDGQTINFLHGPIVERVRFIAPVTRICAELICLPCQTFFLVDILNYQTIKT